jgi:hypothetical protein
VTSTFAPQSSGCRLSVLRVTRYCNILLFLVTSKVTRYFYNKVTSNSNILLLLVTRNANHVTFFVTFESFVRHLIAASQYANDVSKPWNLILSF